MPAVRQKLHLSLCPNFRDQLSLVLRLASLLCDGAAAPLRKLACSRLLADWMSLRSSPSSARLWESLGPFTLSK